MMIPKPPIGVMPKFAWDDQREKDLAEAIKRYLDGGFKLSPEWIMEYNQLVELRQRGEKS